MKFLFTLSFLVFSIFHSHAQLKPAAKTTLTCNDWLSTPALGDYATVGDLDVTGNQVTVEAMVNRAQPLTAGLYYGHIVSKHTGTPDVNYALLPNGCEITTSTGYHSTFQNCQPIVGKNYHVAMVYDGVNLKFYRNGFLLSQVPCTGNVVTNNLLTTINQYAGGALPNNQVLGYTNEVRIWNVARTQAQLQTYMNTSLPSPATQPGLLGYYVFNDLLNKQGNPAYNVTLHGGAAINQTNSSCSFVADSCPVSVPVSNIINTYTPVLALNPCNNKITVEDASTFNPGDTVLMIQMKGAVIDSTNTAAFGNITNLKNAGNYEFNYVKSKSGNIIELLNNLTRQYDIPTGKVQLIRVPYYYKADITSTLTCLPWDGNKGGVLVLNVRDTITMNADIDVSGKGFKGGNGFHTNPAVYNCDQTQFFYPANSDLGSGKGEGIALVSTAKNSGKGKNANAGGGGNSHNAGGGGGANANTGGIGGYEFEGACSLPPFDNRGIAGVGLTYSNAANRIFLGGGGGAGHGNNPENFFPNGGDGGGIVIIISDVLKGNNRNILANGNNGLACSGFGATGCHEGMGGGGAAGTILLSVNTYSTIANAKAIGGKGADMVQSGNLRVAPGGGGSGGACWVKNASLPGSLVVNVTAGANGVCTAYGNDPWGAAAGQNGLSLTNLNLPFDNTLFKPNIDSVRIKDSLTACRTYDFKGLAYTNTSPITSWNWYFGDAATANTQNTVHTYASNGTYTVKLVVTDANGCKDSISKAVVVTAPAVSNVNTNVSICAGQNYTLSSGVTVNSPGIYLDTVRTSLGCDSIRTTINLSVQNFTTQIMNASVCAGQSYTLPWGTVVNTAGTYNDTLHYVSGCDSIRRSVILTVQTVTIQNSNASICAGQSYTLPWGPVVNTTGVYNDTLHYVTGCDSVRRSINLTVQNFTTQNTNAFICAGQSYTLPSGTVVTLPGIYNDTVHYTTGCDSIRRVINLSLQNVTTNSSSASICAGQSYTLPWGTVVNTAGTYNDTLHYVSGCDSIRRSLILTVQTATIQNTNASICAGQSYTLPWGPVVNTTGVYNDTLHYVTGCDSVRRSINLTVQNFTTQNTNAFICAGQSYTLPSGTVVTLPGIYYDTVHYITGCDSIRRVINLSLQNVTTNNSSASICAGQSYTLPWGTIVSTPGIYNDTLHYVSGCDSIRRSVTLSVQAVSTQNINASICSGQSYTLPWGTVVNTQGIYSDTLHYITGCDSVRKTVNLTVQQAVSTSASGFICAGQSYTLPWGTVVNAPGNYYDTLHYISGCDSVRRSVTLTVQNAVTNNSSASICAGQSYTLPWGTVVNTAGTYYDTLHYVSGCDSVRRSVSVSVQTASTQSTNAAICSGGSYTLPWGTVVNTAGTYSDTLHYLTGCDSIRRSVNLSVTAATVTTTQAAICSDQFYTLPWGGITNTAGVYNDTVRTSLGCDSLIRRVNLNVNPVPFLTVVKTNDINCSNGSAQLFAFGAGQYQWSPITGLNNPFIQNPVASPSTTTLYTVTGTDINGCRNTASVNVQVAFTGNAGYFMPNSFTPNNDGLNDCFGIKYFGQVTEFTFMIYNRYGERLFYTNDPNACWDGMYKGKISNQGSYVYYLKAKTACGPVERKGNVLLIK